MPEIHIQGYGSTLEVCYSVINKNDIQSKDDLYKAYLENLIEFYGSTDSYFSTVEYQNDNYKEISVKENLIRSPHNIVPDPTEETIVIATYTINKKGYVEFNIDDEIPVDVFYLLFNGDAWIENVSQNGEEIDIEITYHGKPNEEGVACFYLNTNSELEERYNGSWFSISDTESVDEEIEEAIRESTDAWHEDIFH